MNVPKSNNCLDCKFSSLRLSKDPNYLYELACTKTDLNILEVYIVNNEIPNWCPLVEESEDE